ncbi:hypothetical protein PVAP13_3KG113000 [Panicum virgatum]|uniref:Receptor-like serine/threonine-protein kinase n=1 Tax=Panicum virgatum TaxID=38727 RepID=A0A8T0UHY3_PANVG|nr:hypothetical protein PVAP13_3KG113000 [Panicum virgatum]
MPTLYILLGGLLLFSSLHTTSFAATAKGDTLAAGEALAASDKLISRNGKFALGFFQFQQGPGTTSKSPNTTNTSSSLGWYLGIWFNKIPDFTTVWVANREKHITDRELKLAQLKISRDGNLVIMLSKASTESIIWSTTGIIFNSTNNTSAVLMNNGNLALIPENSSNEVPLWQSFDYPTDVGLPGAKIGRNKVTGFNHQFISKKSLIDPGLSSYSVQIDTNGVLLLRSWMPPFVVYWSWPSGKLAELVSALNALLDMDPRTKGLLKPTYVDNDKEVYFTYTLVDESTSVFVPIDITGQLKLKVWSQATESWQNIYAQPSDFCTTYAVCGPFTFCNGNSSPFCSCMESFYQKSPQDWELDDRTGGCARNTALDCITNNKSTTSSTDVFQPVARVALPYDPRRLEDATTQSSCAKACLNDCSCTAYAYNNSICSVWHGELLNVNQDDGNAITSQDVLYIRLAARDLQSFTKNNKRIPRVVVVACSASLGILMMLLLLLMIWRNIFKLCGVPFHGIQGISGGIVAFRYTDLCHRLGGGGFGSVFKGVLSDSTTIAVKRLDGARQGEKHFRAEVSSIGLIQHINLVKLIGFCCGGDKRLLEYEHMPNGSLDGHLFQSNAPVLSWSTRYQIAIGVARGLLYLHRSCRECIIHCDIKQENILLDASFVPKIADFGMAGFIGRDYSRVLTTFRGTAGYLAPEWLSGVAITPKVDVYSFGMVLQEIISGRRNSPEVHSSNGYHGTYFPVQAISKLHEGDLQTLMDPKLQGDFNLHEAERVCRVACWCIHENEFDRPEMVEVVRALEGLQEFDIPQCQDYLL